MDIPSEPIELPSKGGRVEILAGEVSADGVHGASDALRDIAVVQSHLPESIDSHDLFRADHLPGHGVLLGVKVNWVAYCRGKGARKWTMR
jgi:hypothetical protein